MTELDLNTGLPARTTQRLPQLCPVSSASVLPRPLKLESRGLFARTAARLAPAPRPARPRTGPAGAAKALTSGSSPLAAGS